MHVAQGIRVNYYSSSKYDRENAIYFVSYQQHTFNTVLKATIQKFSLFHLCTLFQFCLLFQLVQIKAAMLELEIYTCMTANFSKFLLDL